MILLALSAPAIASEVDGGASTFFDNLHSLCGNTYGGYASAGSPPDIGLEGLPLKIDVRDCTADTVVVGLIVADDRSRSWIIRKGDERLSIEHVERDAQGAPTAVSGYGGSAGFPGRPNHQEFRTNAESRRLLGSHGRGDWLDTVWTINLDPARRLTYETSRTNYRSRLEFDLTKTVVAPPAAATVKY